MEFYCGKRVLLAEVIYRFIILQAEIGQYFRVDFSW